MARIEETAGAGKKLAIWIAGMTALAATVMVIVLATRGDLTHSPSYQCLIGRWIRPDGGYVLEIRKVQPDGRLEAAYFNPRPIRVAGATCREDGDTTVVSVELRDVNYPGSTYSLRYVPGEDRLAGEYFQAMQRQTFPVEFIRSN